VNFIRIEDFYTRVSALKVDSSSYNLLPSPASFWALVLISSSPLAVRGMSVRPVFTEVVKEIRRYYSLKRLTCCLVSFVIKSKCTHSGKMKDYPVNVHSVSPAVRGKRDEHVYQRKDSTMADDKQSWQRSGWHGGRCSKGGRSYATMYH